MPADHAAPLPLTFIFIFCLGVRSPWRITASTQRSSPSGRDPPCSDRLRTGAAGVGGERRKQREAPLLLCEEGGGTGRGWPRLGPPPPPHTHTHTPPTPPPPPPHPPTPVLVSRHLAAHVVQAEVVVHAMLAALQRLGGGGHAGVGGRRLRRHRQQAVRLDGGEDDHAQDAGGVVVVLKGGGVGTYRWLVPQTRRLLLCTVDVHSRTSQKQQLRTQSCLLLCRRTRTHARTHARTHTRTLCEFLTKDQPLTSHT